MSCSDGENKTVKKYQLRQSEIGLANYLIPKNIDKQDYWNEHWPIIETMLTLEPILDERIHFFRSGQHKRENAIALIVIADMAWQQIRILAGITGKDSDWLQSYLPQDYDHLRNMGFDSYDLDIGIVNDFVWLFDLHSALRHPKKEYMKKYPFILHNPWPAIEANRLIQTAESLLHILYVFTDKFDESGWEEDIQRKKKFAETARIANA